MKMKMTFLFLLVFCTLTWGQKPNEILLLLQKNDTMFYFIETLRTTNIECFKLENKMIKIIKLVKNKEDKNIYGNFKGGTILIYLKKQYKNIKLKGILKEEIYDHNTIKFFIENSLTTKENILNFYVHNLSRIEFIKQNSTIEEIRLTKLKTNRLSTFKKLK